MYQVGIVTLSDKGAKGERQDLSGPKIQELLPKDKYEVISYEVKCDLILTTGGTGFSPRDITPEATMDVAERNAPGIAEGLRACSMQFTKRAMLGRGVSVIRKGTLIINLPGSVKAVTESMEFLIGNIEHGLDILMQTDSECGRA